MVNWGESVINNNFKLTTICRQLRIEKNTMGNRFLDIIQIVVF